ncbi:MAG TPA: UDP-N-acetylmuramoyl-tripeptide--D-alanyl-D-alanine ligase [Gammaproteobacteria bacterium]|nr:UDP-N-acetylmuramoyl-tripeptide--D-alanyl-D-alanine ligase [Gammaproteobacteria bacterium]
MKLSQTASLIQGRLTGSDVDFNGVSTDTRTLQPGELFIAIKGANFDGHDFIARAEEQKAAALLVQHPVKSQLPYVLVNNTITALGQLATHHRQQFSIPLIGVTGSCGKTTVKAMIASILSHCGEVLFSESSFNNDIGLPLTLMRLNPSHQYAVIEMGTNHFGEIAALTQIARPTVALINNAAAAHLEGLGDVKGVSRAKGEIFQGLTADGVGIINADDTYASYWETLVTPRKMLHFSIAKNADIMAKNIQLDANGKAHFTLITPQGETVIKLPLLGRHNVANALAAASAACAVHAPLSAIKAGLEGVIAVKKRLNEYSAYNGARLIDDTYNANPLSFKAAIEILANLPGERILVLGDMRELGNQEQHYHQELGLEARRLGIERVFAFGELSKATTQAFGAQGQHFQDHETLIQTLKTNLNDNTTVLVKGSRSMHMERVVEALIVN